MHNFSISAFVQEPLGLSRIAARKLYTLPLKASRTKKPKLWRVIYIVARGSKAYDSIFFMRSFGYCLRMTARHGGVIFWFFLLGRSPA